MGSAGGLAPTPAMPYDIFTMLFDGSGPHIFGLGFAAEKGQSAWAIILIPLIVLSVSIAIQTLRTFRRYAEEHPISRVSKDKLEDEVTFRKSQKSFWSQEFMLAGLVILICVGFERPWQAPVLLDQWCLPVIVVILVQIWLYRLIIKRRREKDQGLPSV